MNKFTIRFMAGMLSAAFAVSIGSSVSGADPGTSTDESTTTTTSTVVETTIESTTTTTTTTVPRVKPRVLLVGDSTMAAIRWFKDGRKALSGSTFIVMWSRVGLSVDTPATAESIGLPQLLMKQWSR